MVFRCKAQSNSPRNPSRSKRHIVQLSHCSDMSETESERFANAWASNEDIRFCTSDFKAALHIGRKISMEQSKPWQYIFGSYWVFLLCQRSLSWTMTNIHRSVVEFLFLDSRGTVDEFYKLIFHHLWKQCKRKTNNLHLTPRGSLHAESMLELLAPQDSPALKQSWFCCFDIPLKQIEIRHVPQGFCIAPKPASLLKNRW